MNEALIGGGRDVSVPDVLSVSRDTRLRVEKKGSIECEGCRVWALEGGSGSGLVSLWLAGAHEPIDLEGCLWLCDFLRCSMMETISAVLSA